MNVLKTLRSMGFLKILLWIIVISFVGAMFTLWGGGLDAEKGSGNLLGTDYAVKVGKESFPPAVFRLQYRFYVERLRNMLGDSFSDQFLRGACWGFILEESSYCAECQSTQWEEVDSCWGFYGDKLDETGILEHVGNEVTKEALEKAWEERE